MNDQELQRLLADCEPPLPEMLEDRLIRSLISGASTTAECKSTSGRKFGSRRAAIAVLACGCAASLAVLLVASKALLQDEPRFEAHQSIANFSNDSSPQEPVLLSFADLEASLRKSEALEAKLAVMLADLRLADQQLTSQEVLASPIEWTALEGRPTYPLVSPLVERVFSDLRVQLRASEALAMLVESTSSTQVISSAMIIKHYPNTPAANRLKTQAKTTGDTQ